MLNRHRFERIVELCAALTAHAICPSADREDTAKTAVVTAKQKLEQSCDVHASHLLDGRMAPSTVGGAGLMPNLVKAKSLINNRGRNSEGAVARPYTVAGSRAS